MDWKVASVIPMVMWAFYAVFASLASNAQGEKLTMVFESAAMLLVGVVVLMTTTAADFSRATSLSMAQASAMGLLSAGGIVLQLYAFRVAPIDKQGAVVMISCMFPVLSVVIFHMMSKLDFQGGASATPRQWLGVAMGAVALWLISK